MIAESLGAALRSLDTLETRLSLATEQELAADELLLDACSFQACALGHAVWDALSLDRKTWHLFVRERLPDGLSWDGLAGLRDRMIQERGGLAARRLLTLGGAIAAYRAGLSNIRSQLPWR